MASTRFAGNILRKSCRQFSSSRIQNKEQLRFDGKTAIVTGAGRGLGKEYAMLLGLRGANVIVNDFGGSRSGEQPNGVNEERISEQVAKEINNKIEGSGGNLKNKAVANFESVSCEQGSQRIVDEALKQFGRVDILINNAGILRDKSFVKMTLQDWDQVLQVHLRGSFLLSKACWAHMRKQGSGKIVFTSSTSGLYGNFGQANYAAAKMGLIGLSNTLAIEGVKSNIQCNVLVPMAASRMTQDVMPEGLLERLEPAHVAPLVAWLCHQDCQATGGVFEAAGRWFGQYKLLRSQGKFLASSSSGSLEQLAASWEDVTSFESGATQVDSFSEHLAKLLQVFEQQQQRSN